MVPFCHTEEIKWYGKNIRLGYCRIYRIFIFGVNYLFKYMCYNGFVSYLDYSKLKAIAHFTSVACILIGRDDKYEKLKKMLAKFSDSVCKDFREDFVL